MKNTITQLVKNPDEANEQGEENKSPGHANHIQARQLKWKALFHTKGPAKNNLPI